MFLELHGFSKVAGVGSLRSMNSPTVGNWLCYQDQVQFPSCWAGLNFTSKSYWLPPRCECHCFSVRDIWPLLLVIAVAVGRTAGCFDPLEACIAHSGTTNTGPQGGFHVGSSLSPPDVHTHVCVLCVEYVFHMFMHWHLNSWCSSVVGGA